MMQIQKNTIAIMAAAALFSGAVAPSLVAAAVQSAPAYGTQKAADSTKVVGLSKIVVTGTIVSASAETVTVHVTAASKNAKSLVNSDNTFPISKRTKITNHGAVIPLATLTAGTRVRLDAVVDKAQTQKGKTRWIKVLPPKAMPKK